MDLNRAKPTARRIKYKYLDNGATIRAVHVAHHESLVLDIILPSIKAENQPESLGSPLDELEQMFGDWTTNELMKFGVVSLYHLWEKQVKTLVRDQLGSCNLRKEYGNNDAERLLYILEHELSAPSSQHVRAIIEECRQLTNAIKHDLGSGYEKLERDYPAYFMVGSEPSMDRFRISPPSLRALFRGIMSFWEQLPVDIDHTPGDHP